MGVEAYLIALTPEPRQHGESAVCVADVERTLAELGFVAMPLTLDVGPAHLAAPLRHVADYERLCPNGALETRLRWSVDDDSSSRADRCPITAVEVRFAVGQTRTAEAAFWDSVETLARRHCMQASDGYEPPLLAGQDIGAWRTIARPRVEHLRLAWLRLADPTLLPPSFTTRDAWGFVRRSFP